MWMHQMVASPAEVTRDLRHNQRWVWWLLFFTVVYVSLNGVVLHIVEHWTFLHGCYFAVINLTTVGFGDAVPLTHAGKLLAGFNAVVGLVLFGVIVAVITLALQPWKPLKRQWPRARPIRTMLRSLVDRLRLRLMPRRSHEGENPDAEAIQSREVPAPTEGLARNDEAIGAGHEQPLAGMLRSLAALVDSPEVRIRDSRSYRRVHIRMRSTIELAKEIDLFVDVRAH